jgi:hypothetical protein
MEGLERDGRKRKDAGSPRQELGSEELQPGEGERMRRQATTAYKYLKENNVIPRSTRVNPDYLAIAMMLKEKGVDTAKQGGAKARLLRDFGLKSTTDIRKAMAHVELLEAATDKQVRPRRGTWEVLEHTLALHHEKVWPCTVRGLVAPKVHDHSQAIARIMRVLGPLERGKDYRTRIDDYSTTPGQQTDLKLSQYTSVHVQDPGVAEQIAKELLGHQYPKPAWATIPKHRLSNESALAIILTGPEQESASSCHVDNIAGSWCIVAGHREIYTCSPIEGQQHMGHAPIVVDPAHPGARTEHREGIGAPWRLIRASPGDWVFMPRNWWHQVYATPGSVMLSFYAEAPRQQHYK